MRTQARGALAMSVMAVIAFALAVAASPRGAGPVNTVGCDPAELHRRLEQVQSVDISRACGNINRPWAYRGQAGRAMNMRSYGLHHADSTYATRMVAFLLEDATVDTATEAPATRVDCEPAAAKPMYLLEFHTGKETTFAVLWFELGVGLFFDAEQPLGMVAMGARADSVWAALGGLLADDPLLRRERPASPQGAVLARMRGDWVDVDQLPETIRRVPPKFPFAAHELGISGRVTIRAQVDTAGTVQDAYVIDGHRLLRDEALKAVWQWQFEPAKNHGAPVTVWVTVPVNFTLP
jgi:TonB family protein